MANTQEIADAVVAHVRNRDSAWSAWYIGITDNPDRRQSEHRVASTDPTWAHGECASSHAARTIEAHFINLGMAGGPGGGDGTSKHIYVYKIQSHTVEEA